MGGVPESLCFHSSIDMIVPQSVSLQTGKTVTSVSHTSGKFTVKLEKRSIDHVEYVEADYLLIASGSSQQVFYLTDNSNSALFNNLRH